MSIETRRLVDLLLTWYAHAARDLPWRRDPTPYKVLLSELMLQQTRVDTVVPYFERFVARWPTLEAFARAPEAEVLGMWAGLGYYARARNLLHCAREAVAAGGLPREVVALRALPGIGPYTAGAIASIAFGRKAALVDGNVERVLSRIDGRTEDPRSPAGRRALWARAEALQEVLEPFEAPGDFNQALMELGATVCLPRRPSCLFCPVRPICVAHRDGDPESLPKRAPKRPPTPMQAVAGLCRLDDGWVMGKRPSGGLLPGLWEPVGRVIEVTERASGATMLEAAFLERTGLRVRIGDLLGSVRHVFTHRRLTTDVHQVVLESGVPRAAEYYDEVRVVRQATEVPLSKLARKVLALGGARW